MRFPFRKRDRDKELNEEIQGHLTLAAREAMDSGKKHSDAQSAARRELGNEGRVRELTREMWGWRWLENLVQDVRYGLRILRRSPVVTAVAILSLALGIGANTAIFSLLNAVVLRMLPVQEPERLVRVMRLAPRAKEPTGSFTNPIWEQVRDQQDVFSGVFAWSDRQFDLAQGGESHFADGIYVSGDYFNALGVRPAEGRLLSTSDDRRGCPGAAVLSYGFWQQQYGGDENVVGQVVRLNGNSFQIIGVSQRNFFGTMVGSRFDVAIPICAEPIMNKQRSMLDIRDSWWLSIMGRLKPGWTPQGAEARLKVLAPQIYGAVVPPDYTDDQQARFRMLSFAATPAANGISSLRRQYSRPLAILMVVAGFVLLIACANIASLMLARAAARRRELAVRLAVGASRSRLIRQLLTECLILSCAGAFMGVLFARWGASLLVRFISTSRDTVFLDLSIDTRMLVFTIAIAFVCALLFGVLPAFRSTKVSLSDSMKGSEGEHSERRKSFSGVRWVVSSQVALSLVLLVAAGLFIGTFRNLVTRDIGFERSNVLIVQTNMQKSGIPQDRRAATADLMLEKIRAIPGVVSASQSVMTPVSNFQWDSYIYAVGEKEQKGDDADAMFNYVSPGYFQTLRQPILAGRDFDAHDTAASMKVAIVNRVLARKFFNNDDPVGRSFTIDAGRNGRSAPVEIVGITKDAAYDDLRHDFPPTAFFPITQVEEDAGSPNIEIHTSAGVPGLMESIRGIVAGINPAISLQFRTLEQQVDDSVAQERLLATLSGFFGGLALLLAVIGLYGVLAYLVTQRQKEIGIRMALGAAAGSILRLVLRDVAILLAVGIAAGSILAVATTRFAQKLLFGLEARDVKTLILAAGILAVVALIAGYLPARRASRVDPMTVLRNE
ncbi:MAG TPA: ABC transporter permease [Candidatus Acidoferrales bacterium]|jgi:predicted permease|nr:ABC transporter permease [Candidatus Acidoferrales bacterium]